MDELARRMVQTFAIPFHVFGNRPPAYTSDPLFSLKVEMCRHSPRLLAALFPVAYDREGVDSDG